VIHTASALTNQCKSIRSMKIPLDCKPTIKRLGVA
jgi:hypothetical protein